MNPISEKEDKPPNYAETVNPKKRLTIVSTRSGRSGRFSESQYGDEYDEEDFEDDDEALNAAAAKSIVEHENNIQKQIELNYPVKYVVADSAFMIALNLVQIALQLVATRNNAALSYLSSAIWAALYNLFAVAMLLATLKHRSSTLIMLTSILKLFGMIISFIGFVLINLVAFYHYNCKAVSYYRMCYNADMKPIHYAIIAIGVPCMISSVAVFVYFQFRVLARHKFLDILVHPPRQSFDLTFAVTT